MADDLLLDTIAMPVLVETEVTRSRFVAVLAPVADEAGADAVIAAVRRERHDANHHCTAMVLGPDGQRARSNDDGEPSGTAGAPMLAVLHGAQLTDVVAVVTCYFGGTLLGAGGLVRAYGGAVTAAVEQSVRLRRRPVAICAVDVPHADVGRVEHRLHTWLAASGDGPAGEVPPGTYGADGARFELAVPPAAVPALQAYLDELGVVRPLEVVRQELRTSRLT